MNKINKKDIVEAVGFILMVVSIITLLCVTYELKELSKDVKELRVITNRKQYMLTIKNIDKIVGALIYNEWYIKGMQGMVRVMDTNGTHKELYQIQIRNNVSGSEGKIYLDRNYVNNEIKRWYELSCTKGTTTSKQFITKDTIRDIKELLGHIKIIALD